MNKTITWIQKDLKENLSSHRFEHTIGVMYTAAALAMKYGCDIQKVMLSGLLHDCAKCIPSEDAVKLCMKYGIEITDVENRNPSLLHSKLGAFLATKKYGIDDKEIISAILNHTTGKPEMSMVEKIIFISDYIEPHRDKAPNLKEIRECAFDNPDKAVGMILHDTLVYLRQVAEDIDPATQIAYDYYKEFL